MGKISDIILTKIRKYRNGKRMNPEKKWENNEINGNTKSELGKKE